MPKMKTNKAARKRFKITKSGKVLTTVSFRRHLLTDRSPKKKRQNCGWQEIDKTDKKRVQALLPYGR